MNKPEEERIAKREKFTEPKKGKSGQRLVLAFVALALIGFIGWSFFAPAKDINATNGVGGTWYIGDSFNYGTAEVQQTEVNALVENGQIKIAKDEIQKNKIIFTKYKKGAREVPLMAYINLKGRVVAAISMCEPCRGQRFRIAVDQLVCNTCGTRWKITGLEGISGAAECYKYPPEEVNYSQDGNYIIIDENRIAAWQPRV